MQLFVFLSAIVTRLLFMLHSLLAVWRVTEVMKNNAYGLLALLNVFLCLEMVLTFKFKKGRDLKWFSPAIFIYLISVLPSLWLLEIHYDPGACDYQKSEKNETAEAHKLAGNKTLSSRLDSDNKPVIIQQAAALVSTLAAVCSTVWTLALHQTCLLLLIIGKWFLPTDSETTREQLSQLLLLFVGTAADILEFTTETLEQGNVRYVLPYCDCHGFQMPTDGFFIRPVNVVVNGWITVTVLWDDRPGPMCPYAALANRSNMTYFMVV